MLLLIIMVSLFLLLPAIRCTGREVTAR